MPAAHGEHEDGPEANSPAAQALHSACPFSDTYPGGQGVHVFTAPLSADDDLNPAGQASQEN